MAQSRPAPAAPHATPAEVAADSRVPLPVNEVRLVGRLGAVKEREMPSGDVLVAFTVAVDRPPRSRRRPGPKVDAVACAAWSARTRATISALQPGTWIEVEGVIRRRFTRAETARSYTEVEVMRIRRAKAPDPSGA